MIGGACFEAPPLCGRVACRAAASLEACNAEATTFGGLSSPRARTIVRPTLIRRRPIETSPPGIPHMNDTSRPAKAGPSFTDKEALVFHSQGRPGKLEITPTKPMATQRDLSLAYSPGVAVPVKAIAEDPDKA